MYESAVQAKMTDREVQFNNLDENHKAVVLALKKEKEDRIALIDFVVKTSPFFIPEAVKHAMMENDFDTARPIFESAKKVDFGQLPLGDNAPSKKEAEPNRQPSTAKVGWDLSQIENRQFEIVYNQPGENRDYSFQVFYFRVLGVKLDKWTVGRIQQEAEWKRSRLEARTGYLPMTNAILRHHINSHYCQ